jgi:hypothetical protein
MSPGLCASCEGDTAHLRLHSTSPSELLKALIDGSCLAATVPMTLTIVERDPMASAGYFEGDLLRGLMEVHGHFWTRYPRLYDRYLALVRRGALMRRGKPAEESMRFWTTIDWSSLRAAEST